MKTAPFILSVLVAHGALSAVMPSERVVSIRSSTFSSTQLDQAANSLGIARGEKLDVSGIDRRIKEVFGKSYESLVVEVEKLRDGLGVVLNGVRIRVLRTLTLKGSEMGSVKELSQRSGLVEGQRFDSRALGVLVELVTKDVKDQGYYVAKVEARVTDVEKSDLSDVEVRVVRGEAVVVRSIKVVGPEPSESELVIKAIPIKRGQVLRRFDLDKSIEMAGKVLQDNQFPGAKVTDVSTQFQADMKAVDVTIEMRTGRRLQLQFVGNRVFDDQTLRGGVTDAMLAESDSERQLIEVIEKRYRDVGYHYCRVRISDDEGERTLVRRIGIREGPKVIVDRLTVVGTPNTELVEKLFFESAPGVLKRRIFWEAGLEDAARNLEATLRENGYLKARVSTVKAVFDNDEAGVTLFAEVELGAESQVGTVRFKGNENISTEELLQITGLGESRKYSPVKVQKAVQLILEAYREKGYAEVRCELVETENPGIQRISIDLHYQIVEGISYLVGQIVVYGNVRTDEKVILREMLLEPGVVFSASKLNQSEENIGLLGIFSKVEVVAHSSLKNPRHKDIKISVTESRPGIGEIGLGAAYEDPKFRLRSFLGLAYRNLFGKNHTASFRGELAFPISRDSFVPFVEYATVFGLRTPNPWDLPVVFNAQLGLDRFELSPEGPKLVNRARIEERLEKKMSNVTVISYRLHRYERSSTEDLSKGPNEQDASDVIGSTGPGLTIDLRDDVFNPRKGSFHALELEFAHPALLSNENIHFAMLVGRNSFYVPFIATTELRFYLGFGYARSLKENAPVPKVRLLNEMALGGQLSIRGFSLRTISPPVDAYDSAYYNVRSEIAVPVFGDFGAAVFFDSGQVYPNVAFRDRDQTSRRGDGVGIGLRYKTPIGPVVVDFAKGIGQGEPLKFYFTLGTI